MPSQENNENSIAEFQKKIQYFQGFIQRRIKQLNKKRDKALDDLKKCLAWESLYHDAELLLANLYQIKKGMKEITILDWDNENLPRTFHLNPLIKPQDEVSRRFRESKKLKKGIIHQKNYLEKIQSEIDRWSKMLTQLSLVNTEGDLDWFNQQTELKKVERISSLKKKSPSLPYHEFESALGLKIWVGKKALDNQKLTFQFAQGNDWWLHVSDFPGSHVVLKLNKGHDPDQESILDAVQLALYYSKAKDKGEAEVCITQKKFVLPIRNGKPGQVQLSKHRLMRAKIDVERFERIKQRKNIIKS